MQRNGYIPPHVHMHLCIPGPWVLMDLEYTALQTNLASFKEIDNFYWYNY